MPKVVINGRKQGKNALGGATGKKRATTKSARALVRRPGVTILVLDDTQPTIKNVPPPLSVEATRFRA